MKSVLVTGGAGFIGSHLCERLIKEEKKVICADNFITGNRKNIEKLLEHKSFKLIEADVSQPTDSYLEKKLKLDEIYHLASPASPRGYMDKPIETYSVNSFGTHYLAKYASESEIKFIFASTSEAYGDPLEHPQKESYWGNVNPVGVRACYDVSKRFGEMVVTTFSRENNLDSRIVRIFNTYGPRMDPQDGRVVPNFIVQALRGEPITVHGDGLQTRSFCFVSDLVEFIIRAAETTNPLAKGKPINIGNDEEFTVLEFAKKIKNLTKSTSKIVFVDRPDDDPNRRKPDMIRAKRILGYTPRVNIDEGLKKTIANFKEII